MSVPVADVTQSSDGSAVASWPVAVSGGSPVALTWSVTNSLSQDGSLDIGAAFTDGSATVYPQPPPSPWTAPPAPRRARTSAPTRRTP
ncbi:hypothetical protein N7U49_00245 [Streptomyces sp. AD2-2]|nr:hypothetical protein N7U49_00245 [Streptomyces sp. AD2-2]